VNPANEPNALPKNRITSTAGALFGLAAAVPN